jgi:hypothetical protein
MPWILGLVVSPCELGLFDYSYLSIYASLARCNTLSITLSPLIIMPLLLSMLLVLLTGMLGNNIADPTTLLVVQTLGLDMELLLKPMVFPSVSSLLVVPGTVGQLKLLILVHQLVFPLWDMDLGIPSREIGDLTVYLHLLVGGTLYIYEGSSMRYDYSLITNVPTSSFVLPWHLGDQG